MPSLPFTGRRSFGRSLAFVVLAAACLWRSPEVARASSGATAPIVETRAGAIRGTSIANMRAYLGIPYAAPPVGALRWQPPQPPAAWTGIRPATAFANHCPQAASPFGIASITEDCLYLNVFVPASARRGQRLPVMVWIHGGGFTAGESDDYDPDRLVARGVIVVTLNYRLGLLGFFATSGLDAEAHTHVNYGLLDQQAALAWTHANIAAFGGDPARTTVFGQSAGGESVFAQLLSPGSAGLFSRAIIQSGAYGILSLPTLAAAETAGNGISLALQCAPQNTACQRGLSVGALLAAAAGSTLISGPSPAIDGTFLPQAPATALAAGAYARVPVVQGTNHDEFRLFTAQLFDLSGGPLTAAEYPIAVATSLNAAGLGAYTSAVLAQYPLSNYASPDLAFSALFTDAVFCTPAYLTDLAFAARTPAYAYEFADEQAPEDFLPPVSFAYGAAHGSELQFLYDSFDRPAPPLSPAEGQLAAAMSGYWTDVAKDGTPSWFGLPLWPPYAAFADDLESLVAPRPALFFGFVPEHNIAFWSAVLASRPAGALAARHFLTIDAARAAARRLRPLERQREPGLQQML